MEAKVEAQLPFNCEHVVPQSWFGKHEPMRGDLHHLFACESRCNGFRGNTPFADFPDFPPAPPPESEPGARAVRDDCGKSDSNGFEPAHGKGAAARAAFYFRLRYPEHISAEEMSDDRWPVLWPGTSRIPSPPGSCTATLPSPSARATGTRSSTTPSGCRRPLTDRWDQASSSTAYDVS